MNYIDTNVAAIPNYADRHRHGEPIATSFVESAVNQVVSKRLVKKQQMRWTMAGAHRLLQVRTRVLNQQLRKDFERWHRSYEPLPFPFAWPRNTRIGPLINPLILVLAGFAMLLLAPLDRAAPTFFHNAPDSATRLVNPFADQPAGSAAGWRRALCRALLDLPRAQR
jgi:hypothetical protein